MSAIIGLVLYVMVFIVIGIFTAVSPSESEPINKLTVIACCLGIAIAGTAILIIYFREYRAEKKKIAALEAERIKKEKISALKKIPANYRCYSCDATNCKLWRMACDTVPLLCAKCAAENQDEDISDIDREGMYFNKEIRMRICQIGSYVPAIPYEGTDTYWLYSKVPQDLCDWWHNLPTHP